MGLLGGHASTKIPPSIVLLMVVFSYFHGQRKHFLHIYKTILIVLFVHSGLAVMVFMIPLNGVVASKMKKFQISQMKDKDKRCKTMDEILNGIKGGLISESFFLWLKSQKKGAKSLS